jgi:hypothetical protein
MRNLLNPHNLLLAKKSSRKRKRVEERVNKSK